MISVDEAEHIVLGTARSFGSEKVSLNESLGRVLAEDVIADRDIPPYNRATMDGIAIKFADYEAGRREFAIRAVQAAGDEPVKAQKPDECVQIMTGAAVPLAADTVIPVEDISVSKGVAELSDTKVSKGQFIHLRGSDKAAGRVIIAAGHRLTPAAIPIAASVGCQQLTVSRLPRTVVITTGNELVEIGERPTPLQIRQSNNYAAQAILAQYGISVDMRHLPDDAEVVKKQLKQCLDSYDVILVSGGVSKGNFDYLPSVLADLSVKVLFHGVQQKPGKPFWFGGGAGQPVIFALPGNPVSTFVCLQRYFLPWLRTCLGIPKPPALYAVLDRDVNSPPAVHYFLQAKLHTRSDGRLVATPIASTGSGDFISLLKADGFLELAPGKTMHRSGEACRILAL